MITENRTMLGAGVALAAISLAGGCATAVQTQPERLTFVTKMGARDSIKKSMRCKDVALEFERTEQSGINWYDWYLASGCGAKSEFVTRVSQQTGGNVEFTDWTATMAASEDEFKQASREQLGKTAAFDLGCKELEFTTLQALIERSHGSYQESIGASGCGKKATYHSACAMQGFKDGKHEIVCQTVANAAGVR